jgi:tRNA(adenine34) deaminase
MKLKNNEYYMLQALKQAKKAALENEVPVGCVIVYQDKIISKAYNKRNQTNNALDHAELIAIKKACKKLNTWILEDASIYITLEPCLMCSGAIIQSRMKRLIYATSSPKYGEVENNNCVFKNSNIKITRGICKNESQNLLKTFFELRRK